MTYFYDRVRNRFYCLDDYIGPVTSDFTLAGENTLRTTRFNFEKKEEQEPVEVHLEKISGRS